MSQNLAAALRESGRTVKQLASAVGVSRTAASRLANHGHWPQRAGIKEAVTTWCKEHGVDHRALSRKEKAPRGANHARPDVPPTTKSEDYDMLLAKCPVAPRTREFFGLSRDPFGDCTDPADIFISGDIRYVREAMRDKVQHGGFLAVVGESGAGKTTLREELIHRISRTDSSTLVIEPYVIGMEQTESRGKPLRAADLAECTLRILQPLTPMRSTSDARWTQVHNALRESSRTGNRHVMLIEEAHALPIPTFRQLKRFLEMKDGMRPLLSIILFAQPELLELLKPNDPRVREIVQRLEIVTVSPIGQDLERYLAHRFQRAGVKASDILADSVYQAVRTRLAGGNAGTMVYPLAVGNLIAHALNVAAELGTKTVTGDIVKDVGR